MFLVLNCSEGDKGEEALVEFMENEINLTEQWLLANPKSYSTWHHRFWILQHHPNPNWKKEFDLCSKYLTRDDRNCKYIIECNYN